MRVDNIGTSQSVLGLKLKLLLIMMLQLVGCAAFTAGYLNKLPAVLPFSAPEYIVPILGLSTLAAAYLVLSGLVFLNRSSAKSTLTYLNIALVALVLYMPLFPNLISGSGLVGQSTLNGVQTPQQRVLHAAQFLSVSKFWPNLLILLCAAFILNILRQHSLLRLWDRGTAEVEGMLGRLSLGNALVIGIFMTLSFYCGLLLLPGTAPLFRSAKHLFFGSHLLYYLPVLVFFWAVALLLGELRLLRHEKRVLRTLLALLGRPRLGELRAQDAEYLALQVEKLCAPLSGSLVATRVHTLLRAVGSHSLQELKELNDRLQDMEALALERNRGFLNTILWSLPLLGFLGTTAGIIGTLGAFGDALQSGSESTALLQSLQGLSLKFETTLIGMLTSLVAGFLLAVVRRRESEFELSVTGLCQSYILGPRYAAPVAPAVPAVPAVPEPHAAATLPTTEPAHPSVLPEAAHA